MAALRIDVPGRPAMFGGHSPRQVPWAHVIVNWQGTAIVEEHFIAPETEKRLIAEAIRVRDNAFAPYSSYRVGAAVYCGDAFPLWAGCNVENASFGLTTCAERNAIAAMVAGGADNIVAIAVATADGASPCGACRQVIYQFGVDAIVLQIVASTGEVRARHRIADLLPYGFRFERSRER